MDKQTLSNYGWIVICILVIVVMLALAIPFGNFTAGSFKSTTEGFFNVNEEALNSADISVPSLEMQYTNMPNVSRPINPNGGAALPGGSGGTGDGTGDSNGGSENQGGGTGNQGGGAGNPGISYTPLTTGNAYAIYDSSTQGLYFVRAASEPAVGSTFTASSGREINVTKVYSNFENKTDYCVYNNWDESDQNVFPGWHEYKDSVVYIEAIDVIRPKNMEGWFLRFGQCTEAYLGNFDTSSVTSMRMTFQGVGNDATPTKTFENMLMLGAGIGWTPEMERIALTYEYYGDYGGVIRGMQNWNTSNVTNMECMFANVGGYGSGWGMYVDDVSGWDVSKCMNFNGMFAATAACPQSENLTEWAIQEGANTGSFHYSGPNLYLYYDLQY